MLIDAQRWLESAVIPFLHKVALDQDLAWRSSWHDGSILVDDFGSNMRKDLSYSFNSLDDGIRGCRLE